MKDILDLVADFNKQCTEAARKNAKREVLNLNAGGSAWPIYSDSAGVAGSQIEDAKREAQRLGVPTEFTPDGRAELRNRAHRKKYLKAIGMCDRDGGYGD